MKNNANSADVRRLTRAPTKAQKKKTLSIEKSLVEGQLTPSCTHFSDRPAFHLEVTMGHRLRKSFVRNAFIPDLEVNNKSKGYGVSQSLKKSKSWNQIKITYKNNFHGFRTNLGNQAEAQGQTI